MLYLLRLFRMATLRSACLLTALAVAHGCGAKVPANPTTYAVHGKVTLDGQPLKQGYVRFDPAVPGKGTPAEGQIKADGGYEARSFVGQSGTTPGEYKVSLAAIPRAQEGEVSAEPLAVPEKYLKPDTSDVSKTVASGDNSIDIELTSK